MQKVFNLILKNKEMKNFRKVLIGEKNWIILHSENEGNILFFNSLEILDKMVVTLLTKNKINHILGTIPCPKKYEIFSLLGGYQDDISLREDIHDNNFYKIIIKGRKKL